MTTSSWLVTALVAATLGTVLPANDPAPDRGPMSRLQCEPQRPTEDRPSPYDSVAVPLGDATGQVCYSRPKARGRTIFGADGLVKFDQLWRTGANEPTIIHLPVAATIAGIAVEPGAYSIYTIPGASEWTVIVNASITQWGHEGRYNEAVQAQEVGRSTVPSGATDVHTEDFTIQALQAEGGADLVLTWERTRISIPVRRS